MNPYVIYADSSCDLTPELKSAWGIKTSALTFTFDDSDRVYQNDEMPPEQFYQKMREGHLAKTAAVNNASFEEAFEAELRAGNDILYIGFSSGLSTTCHCASMAAEELSERYPERSIRIVDSLAASAGYGLLLYLVSEEKKKGASLDEAARYAEDTRLHICHWFTVDELSYLIRGGRMASAIAAVGGKLKIKPVMHMDNAGHLIPVSLARGRKQSLKALADQYGKLALRPGASPVFICHGDCIEDVNYLSQIMREQYGAETDQVVFVGPVIGAHTGPGVVSMFFVGRER